jgi:hypothetical protein
MEPLIDKKSKSSPSVKKNGSLNEDAGSDGDETDSRGTLNQVSFLLSNSRIGLTEFKE